MFELREASRIRCRAAGAVALCAMAVPGTVTAGSPTAPIAATAVVATGPARSLGEPAAAENSDVGAVAATSFGRTGALVRTWTRPVGSRSWQFAGQVLPAGFGSSYDAAASASPGGPLLVVAGTSPAGENCIANGSVAIANISSEGRLGAVRLVSDQRGTGSFDDRPVVAVGPDGMVWVAWSQAPDADACQPVGTGDRLEVAASSDGGRTFGAPAAMPSGGGSAFGARLVPLGPDRVAVMWTEATGDGDEAALVAVLGPGTHVTEPQQVLLGDESPLVMPGASFYDFPAGDLAALPGGELAVAVPLWRSGRSVIALAAGRPGGRWRTSQVSPPAGADLLLPALGPLGPASARLLCAVHVRAGDHLGYAWTDLRISGQGRVIPKAALSPLTPSPPGPGFLEIGEELSMAQTPAGLLSSVVVAGSGGAALETESWTLRRPAATPSPPSARTASRTPAHERAEKPDGPGVAWDWAGWAAAIAACTALALLAVWSRGRRRTRRVGR